MSRASDLGLYAEEIGPATGATLGITPPAFSHIGLIDAALAIEEAKARRSPPAVRSAPERRPAESISRPATCVRARRGSALQDQRARS